MVWRMIFHSYVISLIKPCIRSRIFSHNENLTAIEAIKENLIVIAASPRILNINSPVYKNLANNLDWKFETNLGDLKLQATS